MAREATARLYDVDQESVVLKNLTRSGKYDHGTITFRAKKGKFVDLDKLHESVWATRLSGGTNSGLINLEITVVGHVERRGEEMVIQIPPLPTPTGDSYFVLSKSPEGEPSKVFVELQTAVERGEKIVSVTGKLDGWTGVWPKVLRTLPPKPRRILVTSFETGAAAAE